MSAVSGLPFAALLLLLSWASPCCSGRASKQVYSGKVVDGQTIYKHGGFNATALTNELWRMDATTLTGEEQDVWQLWEELDDGLGGAGGSQFGAVYMHNVVKASANVLISFGGFTDLGVPTNTLRTLDLTQPASGWTDLVPRAASCSTSGRRSLVQGCLNIVYHPQLQITSSTAQVQALDGYDAVPPPLMLANVATEMSGGIISKLHVFFGTTNLRTSSSEHFVIQFDDTGPTCNTVDRCVWHKVNTTEDATQGFPNGRFGTSSQQVGNVVWFFGGSFADSTLIASLDSLWSFDLETLTWMIHINANVVDPYPIARCDAALVLWGSEIVIFGGAARCSSVRTREMLAMQGPEASAVIKSPPVTEDWFAAAQVMDDDSAQCWRYTIGKDGSGVVTISGQWAQVTTSPSARADTLAFVHSAKNRLVVVGGYISPTVFTSDSAIMYFAYQATQSEPTAGSNQIIMSGTLAAVGIKLFGEVCTDPSHCLSGSCISSLCADPSQKWSIKIAPATKGFNSVWGFKGADAPVDLLTRGWIDNIGGYCDGSGTQTLYTVQVVDLPNAVASFSSFACDPHTILISNFNCSAQAAIPTILSKAAHAWQCADGTEGAGWGYWQAGVPKCYTKTADNALGEAQADTLKDPVAKSVLQQETDRATSESNTIRVTMTTGHVFSLGLPIFYSSGSAAVNIGKPNKVVDSKGKISANKTECTADTIVGNSITPYTEPTCTGTTTILLTSVEIGSDYSNVIDNDFRYDYVAATDDANASSTQVYKSTFTFTASAVGANNADLTTIADLGFAHTFKWFACDTFDWQTVGDGASWTTYVPTTGAPQDISSGIQATFSEATEYKWQDQWLLEANSRVYTVQVLQGDYNFSLSAVPDVTSLSTSDFIIHTEMILNSGAVATDDSDTVFEIEVYHDSGDFNPFFPIDTSGVTWTHMKAVVTNATRDAEKEARENAEWCDAASAALAKTSSGEVEGEGEGEEVMAGTDGMDLQEEYDIRCGGGGGSGSETRAMLLDSPQQYNGQLLFYEKVPSWNFSQSNFRQCTASPPNCSLSNDEYCSPLVGVRQIVANQGSVNFTLRLPRTASGYKLRFTSPGHAYPVNQRSCTPVGCEDMKNTNDLWTTSTCDSCTFNDGGWISGWIDISNCGNYRKDWDEDCDDGNTVNGDGCSSTCTVEAGYTQDNEFGGRGSFSEVIPPDNYKPGFGFGSVMVTDDTTHLYLFGGNMAGFATNELWDFNTADNLWTELSLPTDELSPTVRSGASICYYAGQIVIFGGEHADFPVWRGSPFKNDLWSYSIADKEWTTVSPGTSADPPERTDSPGVLVGHLFYIFGGKFGQLFKNDLWVLNLKTFQWSQLETDSVEEVIRPCRRGGHVLQYDAAGQRLILFGGMHLFGNPFSPRLFNDVWAYDLQTSAWSKLFDPEVVTSTGFPPGLFEKMSPAEKAEKGDYPCGMPLATKVMQRSRNNEVPAPRAWVASAMFGESLVIFGGSGAVLANGDSSGSDLSDVWEFRLWSTFDDMANRWEKLFDNDLYAAPRPRQRAAFVKSQGWLWLFGGRSSAVGISDMYTYGRLTFPIDTCSGVICQYASTCAQRPQSTYECLCNAGFEKAGAHCVSSLKDMSTLKQSGNIATAIVSAGADVRPPSASVSLLCTGLLYIFAWAV